MDIRKPTFFLNADDSNGGGAGKSDDKPNPDTEADAKTTPDPVALAAEIAKLREERDGAKKRERLANERLREIESKKSETERTEAEKTGDVQRLRESFQAEKSTLEAKTQRLETQLKERDKREAFLTNASVFTDSTREDVWALVSSKLDVEEQDGGFKVVVKDSHLSVADFLKKFAEEKPHFAANAGKAGSGAKGAGGSADGKATSIPADFGGWPIEKKKEWMRANPELASEAAAGALGRG